MPLKSGHHWPAGETPFKWRFAGVPMITQIECWLGSFVISLGIWTSIAKRPHILEIFRGWGGGVWTPCRPLCIRK